MNEKKKRYRKTPWRGRISRRIILKYLLVLAIFLVLSYLVLIMLNEISYIGIEEELLFCGVVLVVWQVVTLCFLTRPVRDLDEMIGASRQLAERTEEPVVLSSRLKNVQDELNLVREKALRETFKSQEEEQRKNDLIMYLAHDLKTPLTSVIGYLTLLRDNPEIPGELKAQYTQVALDKAERLEELINEFFDITRLRLTEIKLELENRNLSRMLEQITYEFQPILAEKGLSWKLSIMPGVEMLCDADKLERVFDNLIRNAVNYSYDHTGLSLSMKQDGNQIAVCLENHGKTIPPEKQKRIFEPFFRVDASRDSATGGSGLGLAISKEIVELHGGRIAVESADERIRFLVWLPVGTHTSNHNDPVK